MTENTNPWPADADGRYTLPDGDTVPVEWRGLRVGDHVASADFSSVNGPVVAIGDYNGIPAVIVQTPWRHEVLTTGSVAVCGLAGMVI